MNEDLASGFRDVDRAQDFAVFSSCLTLVESMPFFGECKRESFDLGQWFEEEFPCDATRF